MYPSCEQCNTFTSSAHPYCALVDVYQFLLLQLSVLRRLFILSVLRLPLQCNVDCVVAFYFSYILHFTNFVHWHQYSLLNLSLLINNKSTFLSLPVQPALRSNSTAFHLLCAVAMPFTLMVVVCPSVDHGPLILPPSLPSPFERKEKP